VPFWQPVGHVGQHAPDRTPLIQRRYCVATLDCCCSVSGAVHGLFVECLALLLHHHDRGTFFGLKLLVVVSHRRTLSELGVALQFGDFQV
jgi:hypothetical protein